MLSPSQTGTGNPKLGQPIRLAAGATPALVGANLQLHVVHAPASSLEFAGILVHLVCFVMATLQADQALEAHLERFFACETVADEFSMSAILDITWAVLEQIVESFLDPGLSRRWVMSPTPCLVLHDRPSYPGSSQASQKRSVEMVEGLFIL